MFMTTVFSKQQLIRLRQQTKKDFRGTDRERIMRKIDTTERYEKLLDKVDDDLLIEGLSTDQMDDELTQAATEEANQIFDQIENDLDTEKFTNLRFYLGTPYYERSGKDPFPLYTLDDPVVASLSKLALSVMTDKFHREVNDENRSRVNVIIRRYRKWDVINFHHDRHEFGEEIYGIVLDNHDSDRGLMLTKDDKSFMLDEKPGMAWCLRKEARWEWKHGYCSAVKCKSKSSHVRTSMSMRIYEKESYIPNTLNIA